MRAPQAVRGDLMRARQRLSRRCSATTSATGHRQCVNDPPPLVADQDRPRPARRELTPLEYRGATSDHPPRHARQGDRERSRLAVGQTVARLRCLRGSTPCRRSHCARDRRLRTVRSRPAPDELPRADRVRGHQRDRRRQGAITRPARATPAGCWSGRVAASPRARQGPDSNAARSGSQPRSSRSRQAQRRLHRVSQRLDTQRGSAARSSPWPSPAARRFLLGDCNAD